MKSASQELLDYLHQRDVFYMCDLYELRLENGLVFRYADYDQDIRLSANDGRIFSSKGPGFKRNRIKLAAGVTVDTLNVTVYVEESDCIGNIPLLHVAHNGGLDCAELVLYRCFMDMPGVVIDIVEMFSGEIDVEEGGGLSMTWKVKSSVQRLNVLYPKRNYYPSCPYSLFDAGCGLRLETVIKEGKITAVESAQAFYIDIGYDTGFYDQGGIEFLNGNLSGVTLPIKYSETKGKVTTLLPVSVLPSVGDAIRVFPGCDKQPTTCKNKFHNFSHNRATPYIPLPEAII